MARGDTVALWLVNRLDWLVLHLALARLGAAALTVNTRYRGAEVSHLLRQARPRLLVLQQHFRRNDFGAVLQEIDPASAASLQQVVAAARSWWYTPSAPSACMCGMSPTPWVTTPTACGCSPHCLSAATLAMCRC